MIKALEMFLTGCHNYFMLIKNIFIPKAGAVALAVIASANEAIHSSREGLNPCRSL